MRYQTRRFDRLYWPALALACALIAPRAIHAQPPATTDDRPVVLFVGTSLTAGYGLPSDEAYPALLQAKIDAEGLEYRVVNAGVSGDTSAGGLRRIDWLLRLPVAVLVIELGANDMLRGLPPETMRDNVQQIIDRTRKAHPDVRLVIAGMKALQNLGPEFVEDFEGSFPTIAKSNDAVLIPFLLEGVAGVRTLNQADDIHPNTAGQRKIAEQIWPKIRPLLD